MKDLEALNKRKDELQQKITLLMKEIVPLKKELETVTENIYIIHCQQVRDLPVWELRINPAKTLQGADRRKKFLLCSNVTWQQMYDSAVQYFSENKISNWTMEENSYKDCGQFLYDGGYVGGSILGVFEITGEHPSIIRKSDFETEILELIF